MASITFSSGSGSLPAELTPTASKSVTAGSYIDFQDASFDAWTQQYLPELYEAEVERYGNRSVASFLAATSAEMPLQSDQVIWSEQGRLHLAYTSVTCGADTSGANTLTLTSGTHAIRKGQTIVIQDANGDEAKAYVTTGVETSNTTLVVKCYTNSTGLVDAGIATTAANCTLFVYGSEFGKGTDGMDESIEPDFHSFSNKPIILKDVFSVSGSDATQIGWVEVTGEAGQSGYLWFLKAQGDTRARFEDYLEMSMLEAVETVNTNLTEVDGTQGIFEAVETRGIVGALAFDAAADVISDFDDLTAELDKQGSIEENMLFLKRTASITLDTGLATQNSYGSGGTSYGVFSNSEDMALNLGFSGFRRGGYDFYKTDWKYLNDYATRGRFGNIEGMLVPAGTSSVYDQMMGKNIRRPFLHIRYRANEVESRKMKSWVIGSVGARNSSIDEMNVHFLSERCPVVQAANNFVLFKNA